MHVLNIGKAPLEERQSAPIQPRKPKEVFKRIETVWTSNDDDITLSDVLHLIPSGVPAEKIYIRSENNSVAIAYEHVTPNTRYTEQLKEYTKRLAQYEIEYEKWVKEDAEWLLKKEESDAHLEEFQAQLAAALDKRDCSLQEASTQSE